MGKATALLVWVIAIGSLLLFIGQSEWWLPEGISEHTAALDAQFMRTLVIIGVAFMAAQVALGYAVFRFGARGGERARYTHGSTRLEVIWTLITAVVFVGIAILGQKVWIDLHLNEAPPESARVRVVGQQFQWNFHYPGADGVFGRTEPRFINDQMLNFVGLDPDDPAGRDDIQLATLAIPVNRPVELTLLSKDVIHSLFIPAVRIKQDTVPGLTIRVHFTATKAGRYEIACTELCGQLHYNMKSLMLALPGDEYDELVVLPDEEFKIRMAELLQRYQ